MMVEDVRDVVVVVIVALVVALLVGCLGTMTKDNAPPTLPLLELLFWLYPSQRASSSHGSIIVFCQSTGKKSLLMKDMAGTIIGGKQVTIRFEERKSYHEGPCMMHHGAVNGG